MTDSATLRAGSAFGRYTIQRVLGAGAFGAVYEATQQPLGKRVALKILHASQMHNTEALQRFTSEAEATAKLRHPHIVDVLDLGAHEGVPFIAMEYLEGESLGARLHREGRLSARAAVDLLLPVMSAVATVHDAAIVHRDLKPDNIFLAVVRPGKVQAKVLDFGIAKVSEARHSLTRTGSMMGTVFYLSPEQARESRDVDGRSDQWALGVILYECITGRCPFPGEAMIDVLTGIVSAPVPPMSDVEGLPVGIEAILGRAMSKDREQRYRSVRAMAAELLPYASASVRDEWAAEFAATSEDADEGFQTAATLNSKSMVPGEAGRAEAATLQQSVSVAGQEVTVARRASELPAGGESRRRRGWLAVVAAATTIAAVAAVGLSVGRTSNGTAATPRVTQVPTPYVISVETTPSTAQIDVDGESLGAGRASRSFARDGRPHRMRVSAPGYVAAEIEFDADRRPAERIALTPLPAVVPVAAVVARAAPAVVAHPVVAARPRPAAVAPRPRAPVAAAAAAPDEVSGGVTSTGIEIH
jgi:tRNA A-37 threonylcarbamoyl transferase component Bud32